MTVFSCAAVVHSSRYVAVAAAAVVVAVLVAAAAETEAVAVCALAPATDAAAAAETGLNVLCLGRCVHPHDVSLRFPVRGRTTVPVSSLALAIAQKGCGSIWGTAGFPLDV